MTFKSFLTASLLASGLVGTAQAATIDGYDIASAQANGSGRWFHTYDGTVTAAGTSANSFAEPISDLTGRGSGTLNDGVPGTGPGDSHLLAVADNPTIDLFFVGFHLLEDISLFSFNNGNTIPGTMTGFDAVWAGGSASFSTTNDAANTEFVDFSGSALDGVAVDALTLTNFTTTSSLGFVGISEIVFSSTPAPVPLPASALLLLAGLGGLAAAVRTRRAA